MDDLGRYVTSLLVVEHAHCWSLVCRVYRDLGIADLPVGVEVLPDDKRLAGMMAREMFSSHAERQNWREVPEPQHLCLVAMHKPFIEHVGVFFDLDGGGVLHHGHDHGTAFDTLPQVRQIRRYRVTGFHVRCPSFGS